MSSINFHPQPGSQPFNPNPEVSLETLEQTATHLWNTSQWDEEEEILYKILDIKESRFGPNDPSTLTTKADLGYTFRQLSQYPAAEAVDEEVLEGRRETVGEDAVETAEAMDNLALDMKGQGLFEEAVGLEEGALRNFRRVEGEMGAGALTAMNNFGNTYRSLGRVGEAVGMQEVVVKGRKEMFGPRHRETVMAMDMLRMGLREVEGRVRQGCVVQEEAVRIGREEFGEEDEMVIKCLANLAGTYGRLGDAGRGVELLERVVAVVRSKGEENLETVDYMNNLGVAYAREERWEEAERLLMKVWEVNRKERGQDHFKTKGTRQSLEFVMEKLGKLVSTEPVSSG